MYKKIMMSIVVLAMQQAYCGEQSERGTVDRIGALHKHLEIRNIDHTKPVWQVLQCLNHAYVGMLKEGPVYDAFFEFHQAWIKQHPNSSTSEATAQKAEIFIFAVEAIKPIDHTKYPVPTTRFSRRHSVA